MRGARGISPALDTKAKGRKHDWGRAHATNIFTCIHSLIRTNLLGTYRMNGFLKVPCSTYRAQ